MKFFKRKKKKCIAEKEDLSLSLQPSTQKARLFSPPSEKGFKGSGGGP
jgi:hypothetical protein